MTITQSFGRDVRKWRKKRGMSLVELCIKTHFPVEMIVRIESGKESPDLVAVHRIITALKIELVIKP